MLKTDMATSSKILQQLFNNIWNNESIPSDWTKGLIVKLTKEEDLQICDLFEIYVVYEQWCFRFCALLNNVTDGKHVVYASPSFPEICLFFSHLFIYSFQENS
jgi:hypothetical protein